MVNTLSNTQATFEGHFIKKLSNTEAELKKSVNYKKAYSVKLEIFIFLTVYS